MDKFSGGTLQHPWGNETGALANQVALEVCIKFLMKDMISLKKVMRLFVRSSIFKLNFRLIPNSLIEVTSSSISIHNGFF